MPIVSSTATVKFGPQNLSLLKKSVHVHIKTKKDRRPRQRTAFKHVILKQPDNKVVALVYESGRCVVLGSRSYNELLLAIDWLIGILGPSTGNVDLANMVYVSDTSTNTNLVETHIVIAMIRDDQDFGGFYPEISPALIYKSNVISKAKAMIYRSGKITITGVRSCDDVNAVRDELETFGIVDPEFPHW